MMRSLRLDILVWLTLPLAMTALATPPGGEARQPLTAPTTDAEIAQLVRDLSEPAYAVRTYATRRFCAIGMRAGDALRAAAASDDAETAMRARHVLNILDRLWFSGVTVTLSFSPSHIRWNQPVDLTITFANNSAYPARVPLELDAARLAERSPEARHVGHMLDIADWLSVRLDDGRTVDLRVDHIADDAGVLSTVQERLNGGPETVLAPGESRSVHIRAFNRGWARYPLLERGEYAVTFEYVPAWEDEVLAAQRVGRVEGNRTTITVTQAAPDAVSRGGAVAAASLVRDGGELIASLVNRTDRTLVVNKNFGASVPFAEAQWVHEENGSFHAINVAQDRPTSWKSFDAARLVTVEPGESVELARTRIEDLRKALSKLGVELGGKDWQVHFSYSNQCDRRWQTRQSATLAKDPTLPDVLRRPLPERMLSARHATNTISAADLE